MFSFLQKIRHISFYFSISSILQTIAVDNLSTSKNAVKFKFSEKVFLTFNRVFNTFNRVFDNFSLKNQFKTLAFTVLTQKCCDFIWFQPLFLISTNFSTAFCWKSWKLLNRLVELFFIQIHLLISFHMAFVDKFWYPLLEENL